MRFGCSAAGVKKFFVGCTTISEWIRLIMRRVISKKLKKPSLKELKKQLTDAVTSLSKSFQDDSSMDVAASEANIRAIEQRIKDHINSDPAIQKRMKESEAKWNSLVEDMDAGLKIEDANWKTYELDKKDQ
jgi:hypothetical protein